MRHAIGIVFAAAILVQVTGTANATPVYTGTYVDMYLKKNTFPDGLEEEEVYLDNVTGTTITGHVGSQTGTPLVSFSSTTDTLVPDNGVAQITATDGYLNNVTITAPGYWFEDMIFSVQAPNVSPSLLVTAVDGSSGTDVFFGWALGNGENKILVLSTQGNLMQSITINSDGGLNSLKHHYISGLTLIPSTEGVYAPEPTSLLLLGTGLGVLGLGAYRRKRK